MDENPTSLTLLQRARGRDDEAWRRLHYLYAPSVSRWLGGWGVHGADADDLGQQVFQAVARGIESFRREREGDTFRGWLYTITRRKFLDHRRRSVREPAASGGTDARRQLEQVPEALQVESSDEIKQRHHRALELIQTDFEDRTWRAFWYCAVNGRAADDVAGELGMTATAVRKAKSRVLRRLKEEFRDVLS